LSIKQRPVLQNPLLEDGKTVVWDRTDLGQESPDIWIEFDLGLFPPEHEGIQTILARYIESEVESVGFKAKRYPL